MTLEDLARQMGLAGLGGLGGAFDPRLQQQAMRPGDVQCTNCGTITGPNTHCPNCTIDMVQNEEGVYVADPPR